MHEAETELPSPWNNINRRSTDVGQCTCVLVAQTFELRGFIGMNLRDSESARPTTKPVHLINPILPSVQCLSRLTSNSKQHRIDLQASDQLRNAHNERRPSANEAQRHNHLGQNATVHPKKLRPFRVAVDVSRSSEVVLKVDAVVSCGVEHWCRYEVVMLALCG